MEAFMEETVFQLEVEGWIGLAQWEVGKDEGNDRLGRKNKLFLTDLLETDIQGLIKSDSKFSSLDKNSGSGGRHGNFKGWQETVLGNYDLGFGHVVTACVNLGLILTFQEPLNVQFRWEEGGSEGCPRSPPSQYSVTLLSL